MSSTLTKTSHLTVLLLPKYTVVSPPAVPLDPLLTRNPDIHYSFASLQSHHLLSSTTVTEDHNFREHNQSGVLDSFLGVKCCDWCHNCKCSTLQFHPNNFQDHKFSVSKLVLRTNYKAFTKQCHYLFCSMSLLHL